MTDKELEDIEGRYHAVRMTEPCCYYPHKYCLAALKFLEKETPALIAEVRRLRARRNGNRENDQ